MGGGKKGERGGKIRKIFLRRKFGVCKLEQGLAR